MGVWLIRQWWNVLHFTPLLACGVSNQAITKKLVEPRPDDPQPPATAGRIVTSSPSLIAVSRPCWKRMSSPDT